MFCTRSGGIRGMTQRTGETSALVAGKMPLLHWGIFPPVTRWEQEQLWTAEVGQEHLWSQRSRNVWSCSLVGVGMERGSWEAAGLSMCEWRAASPSWELLFTMKHSAESTELSCNCTNNYSTWKSPCILKCLFGPIQSNAPLVKVKLPQARWQGELTHVFLFSFFLSPDSLNPALQ